MKLVEVGTTNKTRIDDYKDALKNNPNAILLKVHRSNFSISGFTEEVNIKQLNILKNEYESLLIHDLGSGLVAENAFLSKHNLTMFQKEPRVQQSLKDGSDIVMFSGDKLFGSLQSGIIAGKTKIVEAIKSFSIFRTYRCSPVILYELQETTDLYIKKLEEKIPFWNLLTRTYDELELRIHKIIKNTSSKHKIIKGESLIGGGTLPNITMESPVLVLDTSNNEDILYKLLNNKTPIIPRISDGNVNLDIRSVFEYQDNEIAEFLNLV
jgi:L-seryl-tRNA(Ser) seleniumtransferase